MRNSPALTKLAMILVTAVAALASGACVNGGGPGGTPSPTSSSSSHGSSPSTAVQSPSTAQVDKTVRSAIQDVERYWRATFPFPARLMPPPSWPRAARARGGGSRRA